MIERLGLSFSDGSLLVFPANAAIEEAMREAEEHDGSDAESKTRVVRVNVEITEYLDLTS